MPKDKRTNPLPEFDEVEEHLRGAIDALQRADRICKAYNASLPVEPVNATEWPLEVVECIALLEPSLRLMLDYAEVFAWQDSLERNKRLTKFRRSWQR